MLGSVVLRNSTKNARVVAVAQRVMSTSTTSVTDIAVDVPEAIKITKAYSVRAFDQSISIALNLGLDPRKPNQMLRGMAPVPHGSGKKIVLAVFAQGEKAAEAKAAGADIVGDEDLVKEVLAGKIEFNRCIATPDMMRILAKVARVLGPRGLMPNPKLGTVTNDVKTAIENSKQGQIEYRCDKTGIVHAAVGKSSWPVEKIQQNVDAFVLAITTAKPSGAKGTYYKSAFLSCDDMAAKLDVRSHPFKM